MSTAIEFVYPTRCLTISPLTTICPQCEEEIEFFPVRPGMLEGVCCGFWWWRNADEEEQT